MKKGDLLFVYGTLRRGERADLAKGQNSFGVSFVGEDRINGKMYNIGSFPGLKIPECLNQEMCDGFCESCDAIVGDVFRVREESITALLDAYEGYPFMYDRRVVTMESGRKAWVYTYNYEVKDDSLIESGDWKDRDVAKAA